LNDKELTFFINKSLFNDTESTFCVIESLLNDKILTFFVIKGHFNDKELTFFVIDSHLNDEKLMFSVIKGPLNDTELTFADEMAVSYSDIVPELYETGSSMAYLLYPDPTGMLGELYGFISSFRQLSDNFQRTSRELNTNWLYYMSRPNIATLK
jgi:hypothetical protein